MFTVSENFAGTSVKITEAGLTKQLRELEADGFISRYDYKEIPPRVEYTLTDLGESFIPVLKFMKQWGEKNLPKEPQNTEL